MLYHTYQGITYNDATWHQIGTLPDTSYAPMQIAAMVEYGNYLYIVGPSKAASGYDLIWRLDPKTLAWTQCVSGTTLGAYTNVMFVSGAYIYLANYSTGGDSVFQFNPANNAIVSYGRPGTSRNVASLVVFDSKLYATGAAGANVTTIYEWSSGTTWNSIGTPGYTGETPQLIVHAGTLYLACRDHDNLNNIVIKSWAGGTTWNTTATVTSSESTEVKRIFSDGVTCYMLIQSSTAWGCLESIDMTTWYSTGLAAGICGCFHESKLYSVGVTTSNSSVVRYEGAATWNTLGSVGTVGKAGEYIAALCTAFGKLWAGLGYWDVPGGTRAQVFRLGLR